MSDTATPTRQDINLPWVRNARFDTAFIFGIPLLALTTGLVIMFKPSLFYPILVIDLWFLGYHHVISTYTRICFDKQSFAENKMLVLGLLPLVVVSTLAAAFLFGLWLIVTIYFYWQWWHYTRQSWGISRVYRGKDPKAKYETGWFDQAIFYSVPVFGILARSAEQQPTFIGLELWSVPVPPIVAQVSGIVAAGLLACWLAARIRATMQGRLAIVHTIYMLIHFAIFYVAYVGTPDITLGWLMINIWHNAQYILFVWMYNTKRFKDGIDPEAGFLSYISQPHRLWLYLLVCVSITGVVYWGVLRAIDWFFFAGLSATIVLYQIVNFHHYIVDSSIWKVRKPKMQETLGLQSDAP